MFNVLPDVDVGDDEMDRRTDQEWLQMLRDYQFTLKMQLRSGCSKDEYQKAEQLEEAVELVIKQLQRSAS